MVEITLAMMVVAVGILAIFTLFPGGLEQGAKASGETYASLFSEEVFSALRAQAATNWTSLDDSQVLTVACANMWEGGADMRVEFSDWAITPLVFTNLNSDIVNHAFRYNLKLITSNNVKMVILKIWDGEYGSTADANNVFFTEFYAR